jgi:3-oxoacyl-[acyl-carrier protein] reductase
VNAYCPGPTNTHGFSHAGKEFLANLQPLIDATAAEARMGQPEDIADVVGLLVEDSARWVSGVCLGTNGGYHMA